MKLKRSLVVLCFLSLATLALGAGNGPRTDDAAGQGSVIISKYLQATQANTGKGNATEMEIEASVPRLKQHGRLRALRKISAVGKITYRVLGFQGDSTVKNQVIARYLQAEQQGDDKNLMVTPVNYKFKLKGARADAGRDIYVFQVSPRAKRVGLFKGEVWLDAKTYLPVLEKGRLVKNPSIFFRKVDFERDFAIENGASVPAHMNSIISTRLVGKVNLSIAYSSPSTAVGESSSDVDSVPSPTSF